ncbi:unnamed protein product, partial [Prorocentrum cordatum]
MRVGLAPEHRRASAVPALAGQARGLDDTAVARRAGLPGFCSQRKVGHHVGVPPMLLASPSSLAHARLEGRRSPSSAAVGPLRRARRLRAALFRRARRAASVLQPGPHRKKGRAVRAPWPCEGRFGGAASEARPTEAVQEGPRRRRRRRRRLPIPAMRVDRTSADEWRRRGRARCDGHVAVGSHCGGRCAGRALRVVGGDFAALRRRSEVGGGALVASPHAAGAEWPFTSVRLGCGSPSCGL